MYVILDFSEIGINVRNVMKLVLLVLVLKPINVCLVQM